MSQLVFAPFAAALVTAVLGLAARKNTKLQTGITAAGFVLYGVVAVLLASQAFNTTLTYQVGDWIAPYGISFVADALSASMILLTAFIALPSFVHAWRVEEYGQSFLPLMSFMLAGVTGAFLTGDIFNLFVWFEVTLMSSYVLVAYTGGMHETKTALQYLAVNLVGSSFMLVAIGGIYSTMGTLNMADLSRRLADPSSFNASPELSLAFFAILFCVFALKAGLVPFQFWVPDAYRAAPNSVSSLLSGVAKKVGIYAIIRLYLGVLSASTASFTVLGSSYSTVQLFGVAMLVMAAGSILVGGLGALSRDSLDEMLAYSSIGQVGFIFIPMGVAAFNGSTTLALAASMAYIFNHAVAKSMLFQFSGVLKQVAGSDSFSDVSGLASRSPLLSGAFFLGMISLIGIPPTLGFFGKFNVFTVATTLPMVLAVALAGGLLTILYFTRAWNSIHWGESSELDLDRVGRLEVAAIAVLAVTLLIGGLGFEPVVNVAELAAEAALDQESYRTAVLENSTVGGGSH